jgi:hypothetical protein
MPTAKAAFTSVFSKTEETLYLSSIIGVDHQEGKVAQDVVMSPMSKKLLVPSRSGKIKGLIFVDLMMIVILYLDYIRFFLHFGKYKIDDLILIIGSGFI